MMSLFTSINLFLKKFPRITLWSRVLVHILDFSESHAVSLYIRNQTVVISTYKAYKVISHDTNAPWLQVPNPGSMQGVVEQRLTDVHGVWIDQNEGNTNPLY